MVQRILDQVIALILQEGQAKAGVLETLDLIEARGLKIGLATSSPFTMVEAVLGKLGIQPGADGQLTAEQGTAALAACAG